MKDQLLETAIAHFGRHGFEGAATRAIARDADTAMSSITYHFGGKDGLYLACADHIAAGIRERLYPVLDRLADAPGKGRSAGAEAFCALLEAFARMMLTPETASWAQFVTREQQHPTDAFERLHGGGIGRLLDAIVTMAGKARPDLTERETRAMAILLIGQAVELRVGRASVQRIMQVDEIDEETADLLVARLLANARCILECDPETDR